MYFKHTDALSDCRIALGLKPHSVIEHCSVALLHCCTVAEISELCTATSSSCAFKRRAGSCVFAGTDGCNLIDKLKEGTGDGDVFRFFPEFWVRQRHRGALSVSLHKYFGSRSTR